MAVLSEGQRRGLERAVQRARDVAEEGVRAAIKGLAVHAPEPFSNLSADERDLRIRLRARARQLGDTRNAKTGQHGIEHLVVECTYEHWHRMLFARFLAENQVLMHPDGVPVTLEECEELAEDEGAADGWELAAFYAAAMLPQIFRPGSPIFELKLPPEKARELERLLADLPPTVFTASDSLGWVYQFWQAKKKKEVNDSEVKIGADELPAVTQLFTEPYMVQFLLHNTLGAWWVGRHGRDSLPLEMPYLRFLGDGTPAGGAFDGWPEGTRELKVLDPCCGSGHFLVAAFEILVRFRMAEEGLTPADACAAVLRDNLHGLEIDERCTQIAAFALALAAWTFPAAGGYRVLPELHVACSGVAPRAKKNEWLALAGDDVKLRNGMEWLFELFQDAPVLGSLIDPMRDPPDPLWVAHPDELYPVLTRVLNTPSADPDGAEHAVSASGITVAAHLMAQSYHLVATNVPYLGRSEHGPTLVAFGDLYHASSRADLATMFIERMRRFGPPGSSIAVVSPQTWWQQPTYAAFRREMLRTSSFHLIAALGEEAWQHFGKRGPRATLTISTNGAPAEEHVVHGVDAQSPETIAEKDKLLRDAAPVGVRQPEVLSGPDSRIVFETSAGPLLAKFADALQGLKTGDDPRFRRFFWEVACGKQWVNYQGTPSSVTERGGLESVVWWENDGTYAARRQGVGAWGRNGVAVSQMRTLVPKPYRGDVFDSNVAVIVPKNPDDLAAIYAFLQDDDFQRQVRALEQKVGVNNATLVKIPFDIDVWRARAAQLFHHGLPEPDSTLLTQWVFGGDPRASDAPLHVAISRLLGHRWPQQKDDGLDDRIDDDGIVCLPAVRGEQPAAVRLQRILARAFGDEWSAHKQAELLDAVGCKGWTLDRWLSEGFFQQHCNVFQNRPFIWHIWDGLKKSGFGALVSYHKLDRKLLETLTYNYLGDWIRRQQDGAKRGEDGADDRLAAARGLQERLKRILEGEPPCDIFVRWKPIEEQPVGWDPDINDGVRINIRPFMLAGDVGKRGAGVLRDKPNIKWGKDRGKDPADAPWYELFGGERINDHHLTLAEKRVARGVAGGAG